MCSVIFPEPLESGYQARCLVKRRENVGRLYPVSLIIRETSADPHFLRKGLPWFAEEGRLLVKLNKRKALQGWK